MKKDSKHHPLLTKQQSRVDEIHLQYACNIKYTYVESRVAELTTLPSSLYPYRTRVYKPPRLSLRAIIATQQLHRLTRFQRARELRLYGLSNRAIARENFWV